MTVIYFILFYLNLWLNIYFLNNFVNTRGYPWISTGMKKIDGYRITDTNEYGYRYGTNIYLTGRVRGSYYPYPTRPALLTSLDAILIVPFIVISNLSKSMNFQIFLFILIMTKELHYFRKKKYHHKEVLEIFIL